MDMGTVFAGGLFCGLLLGLFCFVAITDRVEVSRPRRRLP